MINKGLIRFFTGARKHRSKFTPLWWRENARSFSFTSLRWPIHVNNLIDKTKLFWDQYQYLGNCPPTPPLTQQQSTDYKLGGRWAVAQILILIHYFVPTPPPLHPPSHRHSIKKFFGNLLPFYWFGERAFVFVSTKKLNQDIIVWKIVGSIMRQMRKCRLTVCSKSSAVHFISNKVFKPGQQQHETKSSKSCY